MISQSVSHMAAQIREIAMDHPGWTFSLLPLFLALLAWRVWTFTLRPLLKPDELEYLPYWIPFIGHAISFFKDSGALFTRGKAYFGGSRDPFMLYVAGQRIAVVLSPTDVSRVFKDENSFAFDPFIDTIYRGVANVSAEGNTILWRTPKQGFTSLHPNPKEKVLVHTGNALLHKQLLQPLALQELTERVLSYIEKTTRWNSFFETSILSFSADAKVVSLHCWCRDVLIEAQSRAFFGEYLRELEPRMTTIFDEWDINSWMITYRYPEFMAKAATVPRDRLIRTLTRYLEAPREKRSGGVPFVNELEDEERCAGLSNEDSARILMIILWGVNSNVQMTAFWMMAHLLQRPAVAAAVREEITPAMKALESSEKIAGATLAEIAKRNLIESCPLLNSAFNEVLRVSSTGSTVREVMRPVRIGSKTIPIGTKVLLPQRQLLLATEGFGPNAHEVDLSRFLKDKSLERHDYYRPFGGGVTLCSGRFVGKREVLAFVALALWRYDMRVVNAGEEAHGVQGTPFPRLDEGKPSLGISKQVEGDDMIVELTNRKR